MSPKESDSLKESKEGYKFSHMLLIPPDGVPIQLLTDSELLDSQLVNSLPIVKDYSGMPPTCQAVLVEDRNLAITYAQNQLTIHGLPDQLSLSLPHLVYNLAEVHRIGEGRLTYHGAAVAKDGQAILIIGDKGAGKTSLALELCLRHGFSIFGNDYVILGISPNNGRPTIFGGDGVFKLRELSSKSFPELAKKVSFAGTTGSAFDRKALIRPEMIGINSQRGSCKLGTTIQVFLAADSSTLLSVSSPPPEALRLRIWEDGSRHITGVTTPILAMDGQILSGTPSLDSPLLLSQRAQILNRLFEGVGVISVSGGNLREIAQHVASK